MLEYRQGDPKLPIRALPPRVSAKIAAGEVIERPASVVKELLENSLDASARDITVEVKGGGLELIRVGDDGSGICSEELEIAFARHATSKLESDADLMKINTLGFRGEALPSIAAVSEVEFVSRPPDEASAAYLRLAAGTVVSRGSCGAPVGSTVRVADLFARLPARRKFLRSPQKERQLISSVVSSYAFAYPEVRFSLRVDDREAFVGSGGGNLRDVLAMVYGGEVGSAMLDLSDIEGKVKVSGLVSPPQLSRSTRGYISLFVNRRLVQSRRLTFAVEDAYKGMLMVGRHPIAVIDVRLPPDEVDVNVHPAKAEVRFRDESIVFSAVQRAVRSALLEGAPVSTGLRREGEPAQGTPPSIQTATPSLWGNSTGLAPIRQPAPDSQALPGQGLPALRVIGQLQNTYVITEGPDGMYLIDQHAAHERILFERLIAQFRDARPEVQMLLKPATLELSPRQEEALLQHSHELASHGFTVDSLGPRLCLLRAVPTVLAGGSERESLLELLDLLHEREEGRSQEKILTSVACHGSIRAGKKLSMEEMRELVRQLEQAETVGNCPHGRPSVIHVSGDLLARSFRRR